MTHLPDKTINDFKEGIGHVKKILPHTVDDFNNFTEKAFAKGALDEKQKQLIALAISVYAGDNTCITFHTKGCVEAGCSEIEVLEACGVSAAVASGEVMNRTVTSAHSIFHQLTQ